MDKRKLRKQYKKISAIKSWYLLAACLIFLAIGISALRQNNFESIRLRDEVIKADEQNGDIETPLRALREHIYSHMNSDLSTGATTIKQPIQLKNRYESLVTAEAKRLKSQNIKVQKQAESVCRKKFPSSGFNSPRVACVAKYLSDNAAKEKSIPVELYKFDFVSPAWTADRAGLSLVLAGFLFAVLFIRLIVGWWYRYEL